MMEARSVAFLLLCLVGLSYSQTCNIQTNTDYTDTGDLVTLYKVPSSQACCAACKGFEECKYFVWMKDSSSSYYQNCYIKSANSAAVPKSNPAVDGGSISSNYIRNTSCSQDAGYVYTGDDLIKVNAASASACCTSCAGYPGCNYYSYDSGACSFKTGMGVRTASSKIVSGSTIPPYNIPKRTGKRGLGLYGTTSCSDIKLLGDVAWVYNWSEEPGVLEPCFDELGIQFIPMVWGLTASLDNIYTKSPYLLTFNEPNFKDQSNMTPQQAAAAWPGIQKKAAQYGMAIGSPSAAYGGQTDPIQWLDQFFAACTGCKVDFINTHQYDCNPYGLYGAVGNFKRYGKPVWVTEFACYGSTVADVVSFAKILLPLFENDANFSRYAWFGTRTATNTNNLFDYSSSALSPVGLVYGGGPRSL